MQPVSESHLFTVAVIAAVFAGLPGLAACVVSIINGVRAGANEKVNTARHDQTMTATGAIQTQINGQQDKLLNVMMETTQAAKAATVAVAEQAKSVADQAQVVAKTADVLVGKAVQ